MWAVSGLYPYSNWFQPVVGTKHQALRWIINWKQKVGTSSKFDAAFTEFEIGSRLLSEISSWCYRHSIMSSTNSHVTKEYETSHRWWNTSELHCYLWTSVSRFLQWNQSRWKYTSHDKWIRDARSIDVQFQSLQTVAKKIWHTWNVRKTIITQESASRWNCVNSYLNEILKIKATLLAVPNFSNSSRLMT